MGLLKNNPILSIYDVRGIQSYIFSTNRLSENAGASGIVGRVLSTLLPDAMHTVLSGYKDMKFITDWVRAQRFFIEEDQSVLAEVIYIGGGNAVVAYRNVDIYNAVNREFAKRLLEESRTLDLATTYVDTTFDNYETDIVKLKNKLQQMKSKMLKKTLSGAIPIVEQEHFYGFPVSHRLDDENISVLQYLKRTAYKELKKLNENHSDEALMEKWKNTIFYKLSKEKIVTACEMQDLIEKKGENGYVAVVHIDGNGMGEIIQREERRYPEYGKAVSHIRCTSKRIAALYHDTFIGLLSVLNQQMKNQKLLPLRPLILDGDDITFICKGSWGIKFAAEFLNKLMEKKDENAAYTACAGIALVHSHFPFSIAYEMAEFCCASAKSSWRRTQKKDRDSCCFLDYQVVYGTYTKDIRELRAERLSSDKKRSDWMMRPYKLSCKPGTALEPSYEVFSGLLNQISGKQNSPWPRSRYKRIYEAFQTGQLQELKEEYKSRGYQISGLFKEEHDGAEERYLFDALEVMELYECNLFQDLDDQV